MKISDFIDARLLQRGRNANTFRREDLLNILRTLNHSFDLSSLVDHSRDKISSIIQQRLQSIGHFVII